MTRTKLIHGRWVITGGAEDDRVLHDGAVLVEGDTIVEVGVLADLRALHPGAEVVGGARFAVLPGLINAHHHASAVTTLQHGIPDDVLEAWLLSLSAVRPVDVTLSAHLSATRLLRGGITTVLDFHVGRGDAETYAQDVRRALGAYEKTGMRVAFATGVTTQSHLVPGSGQDEAFLESLPGDLRGAARDLLPSSAAVDENDYLGIVEDACRQYSRHDRIDVLFAPPGPQWVSDRLMQRIAEAATKLGTCFQTHVNESFYEKLHGHRAYGKPTVAHLGDLGVLGPRCSLAHGVWLTEAEIAVLADTGAAVCHNPSSNLRLRAGVAPVSALLGAGVTLAMGMDATTLNDDEDMLAEMRLAARLSGTPRLDGPAVAPARVFEMATRGGAQLLLKQDRLGRIAPGYAADLVLIDLQRVAWPWIAPEADPRHLVLMRARGEDVHTVLVAGEVVLADRRPTKFDLDDVVRELVDQVSNSPFPSARAELVKALAPHLRDHYRRWDVPTLEPYWAVNSRA